jgi:hypothetical protein
VDSDVHLKLDEKGNKVRDLHRWETWSHETNSNNHNRMSIAKGCWLAFQHNCVRVNDAVLAQVLS